MGKQLFSFMELKAIIKSNYKIIGSFFIAGFLWLCFWATYNTDIFGIFSPGFPHSFFDLMHGIRSIFPFFALAGALIILIKNKKFDDGLLRGPLGLLSIYSIVGIIASVFSKNPVESFYWGILYLSVIILLFSILTAPDASKKLSLIININWIIAGLVTIILLAFFLFQPGIIKSINFNFLLCQNRPYEGLGSVPIEVSTFGMAGSRPTGWGRYAGLAAIACLAGFCFSRKKITWLVLFIFFLAVLIFTRGRTEVIAFIIAAPLVFILSRKYKYFLFFGIGLLTFLAAFFVLYQASCTVPQTQTQAAKPNPITFLINQSDVFTLSGRTNGVWLDAWHLFLKNPFMGYGFQADRFFLAGQHAHNSIIHALIQAGFLGTVPFVFAFILTFLILIKLFKNPDITKDKKNFLIILLAVLVFFTVRSITESIAFFSADWLFVAPIIAYVQCQDNQIKTENKIN